MAFSLPDRAAEVGAIVDKIVAGQHSLFGVAERRRSLPGAAPLPSLPNRLYCATPAATIPLGRIADNDALKEIAACLKQCRQRMA
jgi:hypothetical protein